MRIQIQRRYTKCFLLVLILIRQTVCGQAASCIHSGGLRYWLDATLGAFGACSCEKAGLFLYDFPECNSNPYVLDFEENFNGSTLDTSVWEIQPWGQGYLTGSAAMEYNSLDNVTVSDGICYITAKKEDVLRKAVNWKPENEILDDGLPNLRTYNYTSSNIWTKKKYFQGKYEIRCRLPDGKGLWPAFWLFGGERYNELDIFDQYEGVKKFVTGMWHDYDGDGEPNGCNENYSGFDFSEWHTVSCIYDFDKISILVDDKLVRMVHRILTADGKPVNCGDKIGIGSYFLVQAFPIEKMSIIVNMALVSNKGKKGGFVQVDDSTPFPASFEIDYIKKWKREAIQEFVTAFPNPTDNVFKIISNVELTAIRISNALGEVLFKSDKVPVNFSYDMSELATGVYFIHVSLSNSSRTIKLVKY